MSSARSVAFYGLVGAITVGAAFACSAGAVGSIVGGVAGNIASGILQKSLERVHDRFFSAAGLLDEDLQWVLGGAFKRAMAYLEEAWLHTTRGASWPGAGGTDSATSTTLLRTRSSSCFARTSTRSSSAAPWPRPSGTFRGRRWSTSLRTTRVPATGRSGGASKGTSTATTSSCRRSCSLVSCPRCADSCRRSLTFDRPRNNRAWRVFQMLIHGGVEVTLERLRDEQRAMTGDVRKVLAWVEQTKARAPAEAHRAQQVAHVVRRLDHREDDPVDTQIQHLLDQPVVALASVAWQAHERHHVRPEPPLPSRLRHPAPVEQELQREPEPRRVERVVLLLEHDEVVRRPRRPDRIGDRARRQEGPNAVWPVSSSPITLLRRAAAGAGVDRSPSCTPAWPASSCVNVRHTSACASAGA